MWNFELLFQTIKFTFLFRIYISIHLIVVS